MKETASTTTAWKPGKGSSQVNLTQEILNFLAETHQTIMEAYRHAETHEEMFAELDEAGFESSQTEWQGRKFDNRYRSVVTGPSNQFRVTVTLSGGKLSIQYRQWWM